MDMPEPGVQLFNLPPKGKVWGGLLLAAVGGLLMVDLWHRHLIAGVAIFATLLGIALTLTGLRELARERAVAKEVQRARQEWQELEVGARLARANGTGVARFLQARGYREYAVRRWIGQQLDPGARS